MTIELAARRADGADLDRRSGSAGPVVVALLAIYLLLSLTTTPTAFLSTDTGGKVATLEAMVAEGGWTPDLGYWAEDLDPDGSLYPMANTSQVGEQWVNVTTLPMIYLARPLYAVGGYRAALLIPMAAAVATAMAARALARRLGEPTPQVMWVIGLGTPVAIYALDFWEHSIGLALMMWGVVRAIDVMRSERGLGAATTVGVLFGAAASMRQEALVYGFVTGLCIVWFAGRDHGIRAMAARAASTLVGLGAALTANAALERVVYGSSVRVERSTATLGVGGRRLGERVSEAAITGAGPLGGTDALSVGVAAIFAGSLCWLALAASRRADLRPPAVLVASMYGLVAADLVVNGLRFVPGLLATTPLAALGLVAGLTGDRLRPVAIIAIGSLPLVWAVQYVGGAGPQWGGRYLLCSMVLLVVVALVGFEGDRRVLTALLAAGFVMSALSVAWLAVRTADVADAMDDVAGRSAAVVVFSDPFVPREGGPLAIQERWLAAPGSDARSEAALLLSTAGVSDFVFADLRARDASDFFEGFESVSVDVVDFLGTPMTLTTFVESS